MYSLNSKIYEFKKLLEKAKKLCFKNQMFNSILEEYQRGNLTDKSLIPRLEIQRPEVEQIQFNFKLTINMQEDKKFNLCEYASYGEEEGDKLYQDFFKTDGIQHIYNLEMIIELFSTNSEIMIQKINAYVNGNKSSFMEKLAIETIIGKAIKSKTPIVESMILVKLMQTDKSFKPVVERSLSKIFHKES